MTGGGDLERLLGSAPDGESGTAEPDAGCAAGFEVLHRYVETELDGGDAAREWPGLAGHLRHCPACHQDYLGLKACVDLFGEVGPDGEG